MRTVKLKDQGVGLPETLKVLDDPRVGGEAEVFFTADERYAVKAYTKPAADREQSLRQVRKLFGDLSHEQAEFIVPPLALLQSIDGQPRVGFVMRRVPPSYQNLSAVMHSPTEAASQFRKHRSWADYLRLARNVASCLSVLHCKGCSHGDIHPRNFMVDLPQGKAVMLEVDGVIVPGFLKPQVDGMRGYMAPEVVRGEAQPSKQTDLHSLAVLLLHTLLFRNVMNPLVEFSTDAEESERLGWGREAVFSEHPQIRTNRPRHLGTPLYRKGALSCRALGPRLEKLAHRALVEGLHDPASRPQADEWVEALTAARDELYYCAVCHQQPIYPYWEQPLARRSCAFCGNRLQGAPAVLELYEERQRGSFHPIGRPVVLAAGFKVFPDLANRRGPLRWEPRSDQQPVAECRARPGSAELELVNRSTTEWAVRRTDGSRGEAVKPGQAVPLASGLGVQLGPDGRLLWVQEAPTPTVQRR
ncbi:MAG: hypothetical protein IT204_23265 [Fimbriimonadaceae bacterium]|nr:hypothetical protein [Fimbriimonadaceae bacterium]